MTKSSNVFDLIAFISKLNEKRVLIDFYADWNEPQLSNNTHKLP